MLFKKYLSETNNIKATNKLLKFIVLVIGIATVYNTVILHEAINSHRSILIPSAVSTGMMISGDKADDTYLKAVVRDIVNLAFNYTPATARGQFSDLVAMYESGSYAKAKAKWYELADIVESAKQVSSVFYIQKIVLSDSNKTIEVTGVKRQYVDAKQIEDTIKTYVIEYRIDNGRFWLRERGIYEKEA